MNGKRDGETIRFWKAIYKLFLAGVLNTNEVFFIKLRKEIKKISLDNKYKEYKTTHLI